MSLVCARVECTARAAGGGQVLSLNERHSVGSVSWPLCVLSWPLCVLISVFWLLVIPLFAFSGFLTSLFKHPPGLFGEVDRMLLCWIDWI